LGNKIVSIFNPEAYKGDSSLTIEAYYNTYWNGFDMPPHRHNRMEIMYVLRGSCIIELETGRRKLKKSEFILIDASVPHGLYVSPAAPCRMMNIEFTIGMHSEALPLRAIAAKSPSFSRFVSTPRPALIFSDSEDVSSALRRIINNLDSAEERQALELELLFSELLLSVSKLFNDGSGRLQPGQVHFRQALQFINQNYFRDISAEDVCRHVGISQGYLGRIFRKETGSTVTGHLSAVRIKKAMMLLEKTEVPVTEIYSYVGVASRIYFNHLFKKHAGMTPSQYRKSRQ
jgi:AraC-like DNA-binding protein